MGAANRHISVEDEFDTLVVYNHFHRDQADTDEVDTITDTGTVAIGDAAGTANPGGPRRSESLQTPKPL